MSREKLQDKAKEITAYLKNLDFRDDQFLEKINQKFPAEGEIMREFSDLARAGLKEEWLCHHENGPLKFSRLAKPVEEFNNFSCDAVWMPNCSGPKHRHPNGELSFCISLDGDPLFDGFGPGWALYKPDTTHTPTVTGGTMLILYFLPEGAMEWEKEG